MGKDDAVAPSEVSQKESTKENEKSKSGGGSNGERKGGSKESGKIDSNSPAKVGKPAKVSKLAEKSKAIKCANQLCPRASEHAEGECDSGLGICAVCCLHLEKSFPDEGGEKCSSRGRKGLGVKESLGDQTKRLQGLVRLMGMVAKRGEVEREKRKRRERAWREKEEKEEADSEESSSSEEDSEDELSEEEEDESEEGEGVDEEEREVWRKNFLGISTPGEKRKGSALNPWFEESGGPSKKPRGRSAAESTITFAKRKGSSKDLTLWPVDLLLDLQDILSVLVRIRFWGETGRSRVDYAMKCLEDHLTALRQVVNLPKIDQTFLELLRDQKLRLVGAVRRIATSSISNESQRGNFASLLSFMNNYVDKVPEEKYFPVKPPSTSGWRGSFNSPSGSGRGGGRGGRGYNFGGGYFGGGGVSYPIQMGRGQQHPGWRPFQGQRGRGGQGVGRGGGMGGAGIGSQVTGGQV